MSWILGLGFGGLAFGYGKDHLVSLMPLVLSSQLSIVGLCACALLPYLFSVFAVYLSLPWMLIPICFAKACSFAYISCGVYQVFGSGSWLVHWLLLFVDTMSIPVLYLYWLRHISGFRSFRFGVATVYLAALICIIILIIILFCCCGNGNSLYGGNTCGNGCERTCC